MFYVYIIKSISHNTLYVGSTEDVQKRLEQHNKGKVRYTKGRMPWKLVYSEVFESRSEAVKRELFFKSGVGREYIKGIVK